MATLAGALVTVIHALASFARSLSLHDAISILVDTPYFLAQLVHIYIYAYLSIHRLLAVIVDYRAKAVQVPAGSVVSNTPAYFASTQHHLRTG
jgi:hypothetical protein